MIDITLRDNTNLNNIDMRDAVYDGVEAVCAHLVDHFANYSLYAPPAVPTYQRTGNLGRTWTFQVTATAGGATGLMGNNARDKRTGRAYGPYMMDDEDQAWMHAGRWPVTGDIARQQEQPSIRLFEAVLRHHGFTT